MEYIFLKFISPNILLLFMFFTSTATIILWEEDICEFAFRSFWKKCLEVAESRSARNSL